MKRPGSETWDFSSTYYHTEDEAKAAALAQLGIVPPTPPPTRVRRINLD
jgi:hypothetical protein